jgi:hypothetical protein
MAHFSDDDRLAPAQTAGVNLKSSKVAVKRDGSAFVLCAVISATISIFDGAERQVLTNCDGAYINWASEQLHSSSHISGVGQAEDEFEVDGIEDVLLPCAQCIISGCKATGGVVEVSGDICLNMLALKRGEAVGMDRSFAFKAYVQAEEVNEGDNVHLCASIDDLSVTATIDENSGKCTVNCKCSLQFSGEAITSRQADVATDAFSCSNILDTQFAEECVKLYVYGEVTSQRVSGACTAKGRLGEGCKFLAVTNPEVECAYVASSKAIEGSVKAILLYEQAGEIKSTQVTLPISLATETGEEADIQAAAYGVNIKQDAGGVLYMEANIKLCAGAYKSSKCRYISSVEEGEERSGNLAAVTMYMADGGEQLWDIAKTLNLPPKYVEEQNTGVTFPLVSGQRIIVYRQRV